MKQTNRYYISRNYRSLYDAAGKAKTDCEKILAANGWINLGFRQTSFKNSIVSTLVSLLSICRGVALLKPGSLLCIQYPLKKFLRLVLWAAKRKKCHIVTIVHDLYGMRKRGISLEKEMSLLAHSHCLIVHNEKMKEWLKEHGATSRMEILEIFDYLHQGVPRSALRNESESRYSIVYAGRLKDKKNSFLYKLEQLPKGNFMFVFYGAGFQSSEIQSEDGMVEYRGFFPADEVVERIEGSFGLVWDGQSIDTCSGQYGEYLEYNTPHKCSLYLQCGLPLIIWSKAAMAEFVEKYDVGFCVESLTEIPALLGQIDDADYARIQRNALEIRELISSGHFLKTALEKAE